MDLDSFLASPRWEILEIISEKPSSPIEIAEKLNTTVSYISQQLKLLEAANLVFKKRTGAVERGKPRTLFSISKEFVYITALTNNFAGKKLIHLTDHHKIILRIWMIEDISLHATLEKFFWLIEPNLDEIKAIFLDFLSTKNKIIVVSDSKKLASKLDSVSKKFEDKFSFSAIAESQFDRIFHGQLHPIYDPSLMFKTKQLKGGKNNDEKTI